MQDKPSLLVTGLNGLVGSRLEKDFADHYNFDSLDLSHPSQPVDITKPEQVLAAVEKSSATTLVHFAAFTNVSAAFEEKDNKDGIVYSVNVRGTQNVIDACTKTGKHLIHISTAYVFDGTKKTLFTETDAINPVEWYGQTKALAEEAVQNSSIPWTILRIDQPFRPDPFPKADIAHRILAGLTSDTLYPQFINHWFGPTYIPDFVKVIDWVVRTKTTGLFHATSGEKWSDFEFAWKIKRLYQLKGAIKEGDLDIYLRTLARPYQRNTALDSSKLISQLDFKLTPIAEALGLLEK